ncbi:hypothetical protein PIB30_097079, partial [Stylosanthes scabra]|nr:hypothetical protein [Stylosanthes scabra]
MCESNDVDVKGVNEEEVEKNEDVNGVEGEDNNEEEEEDPEEDPSEEEMVAAPRAMDVDADEDYL